MLMITLGSLAMGAVDDEPVDVKKELAALAKRYAIEIEYELPEILVQTPHGAIHGERATEADLEAYVPVLVREFGRYPRQFVRRMRLEKIVLCRSLAFVEQPRAAVPDFGGHAMYLDARTSMITEHYARTVIHHEFFHIVDWRDDGLLYRDKDWVALNADGFRYGDGGVNAQSDSSMSLLTDEYPGFLTKYSMSGVEEDKAEVFAHLFVDPEVVAEHSQEDEVLARKVERMKVLLQDFCKQLDQLFWRALQKELRREREEAEAREQGKEPAPRPRRSQRPPRPQRPRRPQSPTKISLGHMACTPTF